MKDQQAMTVTESSYLNGEDPKTAVTKTRQYGPYDKPVEIFRKDHFFDAFLHQLLPGDSFCTKDNPSLWLFVTGNMHSWTDKSGHLNFKMDGMEVLQAKPTIDNTKLLPSQHTSHKLTAKDVKSIGEPTPAIGNGELPKSSAELDIEDVEFKEK